LAKFFEHFLNFHWELVCQCSRISRDRAAVQELKHPIFRAIGRNHFQGRSSGTPIPRAIGGDRTRAIERGNAIGWL